MDESELMNKEADEQSRRLSLIDVSAEDDSLLNSFTGGDFLFPISEDQDKRDFQMFEAMVGNKLDDVPENDELGEQVTQPSQSVEPEITKKSGKYNLRKSLAWDSAFFTSAGFLDPEELSSMIEVDKSQKQMLPGIEEEIHRSTESISTLGSETLTLESTEHNVFEDVRASIQKSSKASSVDGSIKEGLGVTETGIINSSNVVNLASQDKVMSRLTSKKPTTNVPNQGKLRKASTCPQVSRPLPSLMKSISARGESNTSVLKQPKVLGKPNPIPTALTKRASLSSNHIKMEIENVRSTNGRTPPLPKVPLSSRLVPRPGPLSSRSSSLGASPATKKDAASSSFDSSGSTSNNVGKSPSNSQRKAGPRTDNLPSSTRRTPLRIEPRNKRQPGNSHQSINIMPGSKLPRSTSPVSSISECSPESSSSISTLKKLPYSPRASLDIRSSSSSSLDGDAPENLEFENHADDQTLTGDETKTTELVHHSVVKATIEKNGGLPPTSKPSGLRLPSPKIGFFDGAKSGMSSPGGSMQPHPVVRSGLPKSGAQHVSVTGVQNKTKVGKLQSARTVVKLVNKKPEGKPQSPIPVQQASTPAKKVVSPSRNSISPKVSSKGPHKSGRENQLKDEKVGTDQGHGIDINGQENCVADSNDSFALNGHSHVKAAKVTPIDGGSSDSSSTCDADKVTPSEKVSEDTKYDEPCDFKHTEKSHFEDQVDSLSKQVGAMNISAETPQMPVIDSLSPTQFHQ